MDFSEILKGKRKKLAMTQEQVAKQIFVSQKSVSNWENQKTYPDIESLIRLARLYNLSLDYLLLEESEVVKDIKRQAELSTMKKLAIPPLITNISLVMLLLSQTWWGVFSLPAIFLIITSIILNLIPLFYFKFRADCLKYKLKKRAINEGLTVVLLGVISVCSVIVILFIPGLFN